MNICTWLRECSRQVEAGTKFTKPGTSIILGPGLSWLTFINKVISLLPFWANAINTKTKKAQIMPNVAFNFIFLIIELLKEQTCTLKWVFDRSDLC